MADSTGHQFICGGNLKAPSRALLCEWIKACCGEISSETIKGSFKSCGITIATDATEDDANHYCKEGQPCTDARAILAQNSCQLLQQLEDSDDNNPFEDDDENDDDEEADCNEVRVGEDLIHEESNISDSDNSA